MRKFIFALIFLVPFNIYSSALKVGDILLQPLKCWSCELIRAQEKSPYTHMAMVMALKPSLKVIEALGVVRILPLAEFMARTPKGEKLSVRRLKNEKAVHFMETNSESLFLMFQTEFANLSYDKDFLWNNVDEHGFEKMYCSEMITKLLQRFLGIRVPLKRMRFDVNREQWIRYFKGDPPDGKWGNSPATFEKSDLFYEVGKI